MRVYGFLMTFRRLLNETEYCINVFCKINLYFIYTVLQLYIGILPVYAVRNTLN